MKKLYRIKSKFFCAGFVTDYTDRCVECAPILRTACIGKHIKDIEEKYNNYCDIDMVGEYSDSIDTDVLDLFFNKN
jgi:hypothetical protein